MTPGYFLDDSSSILATFKKSQFSTKNHQKMRGPTSNHPPRSQFECKMKDLYYLGSRDFIFLREPTTTRNRFSPKSENLTHRFRPINFRNTLPEERASPHVFPFRVGAFYFLSFPAAFWRCLKVFLLFDRCLCF